MTARPPAGAAPADDQSPTPHRQAGDSPAMQAICDALWEFYCDASDEGLVAGEGRDGTVDTVSPRLASGRKLVGLIRQLDRAPVAEPPHEHACSRGGVTALQEWFDHPEVMTPYGITRGELMRRILSIREGDVVSHDDAMRSLAAPAPRPDLLSDAVVGEAYRRWEFGDRHDSAEAAGQWLRQRDNADNDTVRRIRQIFQWLASRAPTTEEARMSDRKKKFVRALAEYLASDLAHKSILCQMGKSEGRQWAELWNASPLRGYPTVDEAEKMLTEFLL